MNRLRCLALGAVVVPSAWLVRTLYPEEFEHQLEVASRAVLRAWEAIEANPAPVLIALGTFVLTVLYHKLRGKSLRESVEVAATRVAVVPVPAAPAAEPEPSVVRRAKARATRAQLLLDQIALQNRYRKLPAEVNNAEKEACYTEQAVVDAERSLADRRKAHGEAVVKLRTIRKEKVSADAELAEIDAELKRLADMV